MTQKKLNELFEYPDMHLAYKLSYLVKTLSMCFFYFAIFPFGFPRQVNRLEVGLFIHLDFEL